MSIFNQNLTFSENLTFVHLIISKSVIQRESYSIHTSTQFIFI